MACGDSLNSSHAKRIGIQRRLDVLVAFKLNAAVPTMCEERIRWVMGLAIPCPDVDGIVGATSFALSVTSGGAGARRGNREVQCEQDLEVEMNCTITDGG